MPDYEKFDTQAALDLQSLNAWVNEIAELEDKIAEQVRALRARFVPWQDIADELGMTRQGAQQRYTRDENAPARSRTWPSSSELP
jgi:hypothetical protein